MRFKLSKLILILFLFAFVFLVKASVVSAATYSLSPASGSVQNGSTIAVDVKFNTDGSQVKAGSVGISYPADKLEAVVQSNGDMFDPNGSPYSITFGIPTPNGSIGFSFLKTASPFPSGTSLQIARITFKAKVGSGTATVAFGSVTASNGGTISNQVEACLPNTDCITDIDNPGNSHTITVAPTLVNGNYALTGTSTDPPTPNPTPTPTPPATSTPSKPVSYVAQPTPNSSDTTAPKISDIKVSDISINTAKITWTTDEASTSIVEYNLTAEYLKSNNLNLAEQSAEMTKSHSITLPKSVLQAGYGYTFRVRSIDSTGNSAVSETSEFRTKGYTVRIKIVDKTTLEPLANVEVIFTQEKISKKTDSEGVVLYEDIAQLDQPLKVSFGGKVYLDTIVKVTGESGIGTADAQEVVIKVAGIAQQRQTYRNIGWAMILVGIAALIGVGVVWLKNRKKISPI